MNWDKECTERMIIVIAVILVGVCAIVAFGQPEPPSQPRTKFETLDGSVTGRYRTIKVSNDTLADNGDGTATLETGSPTVLTVSEGTASPLEIAPNVGAVLITIASADASTSGYITGTNYNDWQNNRVSTDAVLTALTSDLITAGETIGNTLNATVGRTSGKITSVAYTGGRTVTYTRDSYGRVSSFTDGVYTWTITRVTNDGSISTWVVS